MLSFLECISSVENVKNAGIGENNKDYNKVDC